MIRRIVEQRVNKLLDELEAINGKYTADTTSMSVIQKATIAEVNPADIRRIHVIKSYFIILDVVFKGW